MRAAIVTTAEGIVRTTKYSLFWSSRGCSSSANRLPHDRARALVWPVDSAKPRCLCSSDSQAWAGPGCGSMHLPHAGQEVIVSFLEGDPDRPIVTGRVYDGTNMPWQALPAQQKKSYFRDEGGNYIVMDATKGKERIELYSPYGKTKLALGAPNSPVPGVTLQTQEQMDQLIEKDVMTQINGAMTEKIKKDLTKMPKERDPNDEWRDKNENTSFPGKRGLRRR